jgi:very-short-patch-repair endonuclease
MRIDEPLRRQILARAERQLGHVTRGQLGELGVTPGWVRSQLRLGWLIRVHAGVYALGHAPRHAHARACAAVLACGDGAALSHAAAAALWGVLEWPYTLEVTARYDHRRPGIHAHRSRTLTAREVCVHHGVRVTSPVRTVLDLKRRLTDAGLVRIVNELRLAGHLRATAFAELRQRSSRVQRLLGDCEQNPTRSALEDRFCRFIVRHRLPMPEVNVRLPENGREVDALYREARLIIEIDSWRHHHDRVAFERDREKDADALGVYDTLRVTERRLTHGGEAEAARIRHFLDL